MFFTLSKVLSFLLNPLTWVVIGIIYTLLSKNSKKGRYSLLCSVVLLTVFSNPLIVNSVLKKWETPLKRPDEVPLVSTGIMLGGITVTNNASTTQLQLNDNAERLTMGLKLLKEKVIRRLIISGGSGSLLNQSIKESDQVQEYLSAWGFRKSVTYENNSRNTYENAVEVSAILTKEGIKDQPVLLITSAFHMPRAMACFKKQGINAIPFPVDYKTSAPTWGLDGLIPNAEAISTWHLLIKEWVGLLTYRIIGYA